jgi:hypothetical protein
MRLSGYRIVQTLVFAGYGQHSSDELLELVTGATANGCLAVQCFLVRLISEMPTGFIHLERDVFFSHSY